MILKVVEMNFVLPSDYAPRVYLAYGPLWISETSIKSDITYFLFVLLYLATVSPCIFSPGGP